VFGSSKSDLMLKPTWDTTNDTSAKLADTPRGSPNVYGLRDGNKGRRKKKRRIDQEKLASV
jgi:hypothetical protein